MKKSFEAQSLTIYLPIHSANKSPFPHPHVLNHFLYFFFFSPIFIFYTKNIKKSSRSLMKIHMYCIFFSSSSASLFSSPLPYLFFVSLPPKAEKKFSCHRCTQAPFFHFSFHITRKFSREKKSAAAAKRLNISPGLVRKHHKHNLLHTQQSLFHRNFFTARSPRPRRLVPPRSFFYIRTRWKKMLNEEQKKASLFNWRGK